MGGKSNVIFWLESRGVEANEDRINRIYERAKQATSVLSEEELLALV
jgi:hypothetical protein